MPICLPMIDFMKRLPVAGPLLALDHGKRSIGVAISDEARSIASPLLTISDKKFQSRIRQILAVCEQRRVAGLVLGLPLNMDGSQNPQCQAVRAFAFNINKQTDLPITFCDERLSSNEAKQFMVKMGVKKSQQETSIHRVAASMILQWFMDEMHQHLEQRTP